MYNSTTYVLFVVEVQLFGIVSTKYMSNAWNMHHVTFFYYILPFLSGWHYSISSESVQFFACKAEGISSKSTPRVFKNDAAFVFLLFSLHRHQVWDIFK
jgi:hypothetical protein